MVRAPASNATRAGIVMSVTLGVILAHTGTVAFSLIQPHTSCRDATAWQVGPAVVNSADSHQTDTTVSESFTITRGRPSAASCMPYTGAMGGSDSHGLTAAVADSQLSVSTESPGPDQDPAAYPEQIAVLAHCHAHLALRHAVRAAEVDLKRVHAHVLAPLDQLLPGALPTPHSKWMRPRASWAGVGAARRVCVCGPISLQQ